MRLHFLSGGRLRMQRRTYFHEPDRNATFELPVICTLVRHAQGNLLFDTGCHPSVIEDAEARWGEPARRVVPIFDAAQALPAQLALAGLEAGDIDIVVCSHLHMDHCGCNALFTRATVLAHAAEVAAARAGTPELGYYAADWDLGRPIETFEAPHDVFGDGRVMLLPMPGHTPGMTVAHVALDRDGVFLLASDAVPVRNTLDARFIPKNSWDMDLTANALDTIACFEDDGATVICGHDEAQWQGLRKGAASYA